MLRTKPPRASIVPRLAVGGVIVAVASYFIFSAIAGGADGFDAATAAARVSTTAGAHDLVTLPAGNLTLSWVTIHPEDAVRFNWTVRLTLTNGQGVRVLDRNFSWSESLFCIRSCPLDYRTVLGQVEITAGQYLLDATIVAWNSSNGLYPSVATLSFTEPWRSALFGGYFWYGCTLFVLLMALGWLWERTDRRRFRTWVDQSKPAEVSVRDVPAGPRERESPPQPP